MPEPFWDVGRSATAMPIGAEMAAKPKGVIANGQVLTQQEPSGPTSACRSSEATPSAASALAW